MNRTNSILSILVYNLTKSNIVRRSESYIYLLTGNNTIDHDPYQKHFYRPQFVSTSGNYYLGGIVFMVSIIGLLLYVNLYYENCFSETCEELSRSTFCCCLKFFIKYENLEQPGSIERSIEFHHNFNKPQSHHADLSQKQYDQEKELG
ncbi:unnamed protein product [Brachionus calyciflorus]|uniref:Uncharacterized protein n=1 Tax=Brachionus calyciflorus TaxID=104777 RepID=A0A814JQI6_9BILA|nr:unnamed protein product [Brachionus calyciflorus]